LRCTRALGGAGILLALAGCADVLQQQPAPTAPPSTDRTVVIALLDGPVADLPAFDCVRLVRIPGNGAGSDHGTQVASVITGVAGRNCAGRRLVVRAYDIERNGRPLPSLLVPALDSAVARGAEVINISAAIRNDLPKVRRAIANAVASDAIVVAAAGNSAGLPAVYPAAYPGVLSVGSLAPSGALSAFSARDGVVVAVLGEDLAALDADGTLTAVSGTSFAAASVTDEAAAHLVHGANRSETMRHLTDEHAYERTP
jgi:subtilisin family serine protease